MEDKHGRNRFQATEEYRQYLLDTFGACNWYDWSIKHWGCKWDVFPDVFEVDEDDNSIEFDFMSAWCDPAHFFDWLRKHGIDFERGFEEPGEEFHGWEEAKAGEIIEQTFRKGEEYHLWRIENGSELLDQFWELEEYSTAEEFLAERALQNEKLIALVKEWYAQNG